MKAGSTQLGNLAGAKWLMPDRRPTNQRACFSRSILALHQGSTKMRFRLVSMQHRNTTRGEGSCSAERLTTSRLKEILQHCLACPALPTRPFSFVSARYPVRWCGHSPSHCPPPIRKVLPFWEKPEEDLWNIISHEMTLSILSESSSMP